MAVLTSFSDINITEKIKLLYRQVWKEKELSETFKIESKHLDLNAGLSRIHSG